MNAGIKTVGPELRVQNSGLVASAAEKLLPGLPCFQTQHTEEEEEEHSLEGVEGSEQDLSGLVQLWDSECQHSKQPCQAKEEENAGYTGHEAQGSPDRDSLLSAGNGAPHVSEQDEDHHCIEHQVHQQDGHYRAHKGHPEHHSIAQETTATKQTDI